MKTGRKTKLNEALQENLVKEVRSGRGLKAAARLASVPAPTLFRWLARGRQEANGPFRSLWEALREAQAVGSEEVAS